MNLCIQFNIRHVIECEPILTLQHFILWTTALNSLLSRDHPVPNIIKLVFGQIVQFLHDVKLGLDQVAPLLAPTYRSWTVFSTTSYAFCIFKVSGRWLVANTRVRVTVPRSQRTAWLFAFIHNGSRGDLADLIHLWFPSCWDRGSRDLTHYIVFIAIDLPSRFKWHIVRRCAFL